MDRLLPSLDALRIFAVAARHESFSAAAAEIHVTHGAVSQRIKQLQAELGVNLFERSGNKMLVTPEGRVLLRSVELAIGEITRGVDSIRVATTSRELTVSLLPVMASRWLIPRLSRFHQRHPRIDINIRTSLNLATFQSDGVDLAIRFGPGEWSGLRAIKLADEELFPVCSPSFNDSRLPTTPAELLKMPLLRDTNLPWSYWFEAVGVTVRREIRGTSFTDANLLLEAAVSGQGIALARKSICAPELASGRLVRLFQQTFRTAYSHFIVYPPAKERNANVVAFRDWLLEEARTDAMAAV